MLFSFAFSLRQGGALVCLVMLMAVLPGCDAQGGGDSSEGSPSTYENPVLAQDFPDPTVIEGADGAYYAYATETASGGVFTNIQVARSRDLVNWSSRQEALPGGVPWAQQNRSYWAPHVVYAPEQEQYVMYHSARHDDTGGHCLSVAVSSSPLGPFEADEEPLKCGPGFQVIDAMAFDDPESGKKLLYWGSEGQPIRVQELSDDRRAFASGTEPQPVLQPALQEPYGGLIEGAWVIHRDDTYYLFYSGDNCCGPQAHYAVMVARSDSPFGPFERLGETEGRSSSVILQANSTWKAPGHPSVLQDARGEDWMFYHAINRDRPTRDPGFGNGAVWDRRVMMADRIVYQNDWPRIEGRVPSETAERPAVTE